MIHSFYSVPGKALILGEYSVLTGAPAIVATFPPRFKLFLRRSTQVLHPYSPIYRLKQWAEKEGWPELTFDFEDPYQGKGGFGASTAQFALAYRAYTDRVAPKQRPDFWSVSSPESWKSALKLYRTLLSDEPIVPSGADLVAQWLGGISYFSPKEEAVTDVSRSSIWDHLMVFSATEIDAERKVPTHQHLTSLAKMGFLEKQTSLFSELEQITQDGYLAVRENRLTLFAKSLDSYAHALQSAQLEATRAFEDRVFLRRLPGVLGVKGAGALLSDAVIVVVDSPSPGVRSKVFEAAKARGLVLKNGGNKIQQGILAESS